MDNNQGGKKYIDWDIKNGKRTAEAICSNKLENQIYVNRAPTATTLLKEWNHKGINYHLNNYGFRDKDFFKPADLLISGCSQTWGTSLPEHYRFSNFIEKKFSGTVHNMSYEGNSVGSVVRSIFAYLKEFGNPKYIYLMLPPFERIEFIADPDTVNKWDWAEYYKKFKKTGVEDLDFSPLQIATVDVFTPIYAKSPYSIEDVMNPQSVYFINMQMLLMLEQYCNNAGINLMWSCWSNAYSIMNFVSDLQKNNQGHSNYFNIPVWDWHLNKDNVDILDTSDCHKDLRDEDKIFFDHAMDIGRVATSHPHWGSHRNIHIAEQVLSEMKNRWGVSVG
jgi:hypothetical protein